MSSMLFRRTAAPVASAARAFSTSSPRSIARISIIGNLADTPELVPTNSGREIIKYAVASNSGPRDNRQTSWFRVTSFAEGPRKDFLLTLPKGCVHFPSFVSVASLSARLTLRRPDTAQSYLIFFFFFADLGGSTVPPSSSRVMPAPAPTRTRRARPATASTLSSVRTNSYG